MKKIISLFILSSILISCGTSNNVVQDGLFQKRKHRSGWFIKKKKGIEKKSANEENLAFEEVRRKESTSEIKYISPVKEKLNWTKKTNQKKQLKVLSTSNEKKPTRNTTANAVTHKGDQKRLVVNSESKDQSTKGVEDFEKKVQNTKFESNKNSSSRSSSDVQIILLVILALIIPPLAVYLVQEASTIFLIDLILFIVGISSFWFFSLGGLASLAAVVIALLVVFGVM